MGRFREHTNLESATTNLLTTPGTLIIQKVEALRGDGCEAPLELLDKVQDFLSPLQREFSNGNLADLRTARHYAPWLVQFTKAVFGNLGKTEPGECQDVLVKCACIAVDMIQASQLAIKGRKLEIELQMYSLVRKLVSIRQYETAAKYGKALYMRVCRYCNGQQPKVNISEENKAWPAPPTPCGSHDKSAAGLLVCALLNVMLCATEDPSPSQALLLLSETIFVLSGIEIWLRTMKAEEYTTYGNSLLQCCLKGVSKVKILLAPRPATMKHDIDAASAFFNSLLEFSHHVFGSAKTLQLGTTLVKGVHSSLAIHVVEKCYDLCGSLQDNKVEMGQMLSIYVRESCDGEWWSEGCQCLQLLLKNKPVLEEMKYYEVALSVHWYLEMPVKPQCNEDKMPSLENVVRKLHKINGAIETNLERSGMEVGTMLQSTYLALEVLRKTLDGKCNFLEKVPEISSKKRSAYFKLAKELSSSLDFICKILHFSCEQGRPAACFKWVTPQVWSSAAAAAVQATDLRCSLLRCGQAGRGQICNNEFCSLLWKFSSDGRGLNQDALKWLASSMYNLGMAIVTDDAFQAVAPMKVSVQAAIKCLQIAFETQPEDSEECREMMCDTSLRCCSIARALMRERALLPGLELLAHGAHSFVLHGWDAKPILQVLIKAWFKSHEADKPECRSLWQWMSASLPVSIEKNTTTLALAMLKSLQNEAQTLYASEELFNEFDIIIGVLRTADNVEEFDIIGAITYRHLLQKNNCDVRSLECISGQQEWSDFISGLNQFSEYSKLGTKASGCMLFVKCMQAIEEIEEGNGHFGNDHYTTDPWFSISMCLSTMDDVLRKSSNFLCEGWAPGFSLGQEYELWMLFEISCMAALHGQCALALLSRRLCTKLSLLFVRQGLISDVAVIHSFLKLVPAICSLENVVSLVTLQPCMENDNDEFAADSAFHTIKDLISALADNMGKNDGFNAVETCLLKLQHDKNLSTRSALGFRAWTHILASLSLHSAGRIVAGLYHAREGFRMASAFCRNSMDASKPNSNGGNRLNALCSGGGRWLVLQMQLCSCIALGQLCEVAGYAEEAISAFKYGVLQAEEEHTFPASSLFSILQLDIEMKLQLDNPQIQTTAGESSVTCSSRHCQLCSCMMEVRRQRISGDIAYQQKEFSQALGAYSEAKVHLEQVSNQSMVVPGWHMEMARTVTGLCLSLISKGNAKGGLDELEQGIARVRTGDHESNNRPVNSLAYALLLWQRARLDWNEMLEMCIKSVQQPCVWGAPTLRKQQRNYSRKSKFQSITTNDVTVKSGLLEILLQAYEFGREAPQLRRDVSLALATITNPKAALVFLQLSKNCTVQQQHFSHVLAKQAESDNMDDLHELCWMGSILEPPSLPETLLKSLRTRVRRGKVVDMETMALKKYTTLLDCLEDWATKYLQSCSEFLPEGIAFCTLSMIESQGAQSTGAMLLLCRWTPERYPIIVQFPIKSISTSSDDGNLADSCLKVNSSLNGRLQSILLASTNMVKNFQGHAEATQKRQWWKARLELDLLVKDVVSHMETEWLGPLAFLLMGAVTTPSAYGSSDEFPDLDFADEDLTLHQEQTLKELVRVLQETMPASSEDMTHDADTLSAVANLLGLKPCTEDKIIEKMASLKLTEMPTTSHNLNTPLPEDGEKARIHQRSRQRTATSINCDRSKIVQKMRSGKIGRMASAEFGMDGNPCSTGTRQNNIDTARNEKKPLEPTQQCYRQPVLLVLDSHLQQMPWESCSRLHDTCIYRVPSLATASVLQHAQKLHGECGEKPVGQIDPKSAFYMLNPDQDLKSTQATFENWFQQQQTWDGVIGDSVPHEELLTKLQMRDLFLYFGHGSSEKHLSTKHIWRMHRCPVALLMGCSSGRLRDRGKFEPVGVMSTYAAAGCPSVIVNLWDVTDRDIDRFSHSILLEWIGPDKELPENPGIRNAIGCEGYRVAQSVTAARGTCRMPYLTGAAPVCYGVPTIVKSWSLSSHSQAQTRIAD